MKVLIRRTVFLFFFAASLFFTACSNITGYSVLLWNLPDYSLHDGDIVPVYIKSNISQVYVIGIPDSDEKIEVPLWQITAPQSKGKTLKASKRYEEYKHQYASVKIDGLPIRSEPVNTAKQVYRLRKNETIKILYSGQGQPVMMGQKQLEGDWLRVLTQDGSSGWCFSYNLQQYQIDSTGTIIGAQDEVIQEEDIILKNMLSKRWYPDSYTAMIRDKHIDVGVINSSYGFETGAESGTVALTMSGILEKWPYNGVSKTADGTYKYNDIPIEITVRNDNFIVVRYTDSTGKPQDFNLVTIAENIDELIAAEVVRRQEELLLLRENGGHFRSSNYGQLTFGEDDKITWRGYNLLVPSLIPRNTGTTGTVSIQYFISNSLKANYDGILTFKLDKMNKELNFVYKIEETGIRLTDAGGAQFRGTTVQSLSASPLVLFFAKQ